MPEAPTLAVSVQTEGLAQDVAVSQPPSEVAPKTEFAAEEFIEVWRPTRRDEHARKPLRGQPVLAKWGPFADLAAAIESAADEGLGRPQ